MNDQAGYKLAGMITGYWVSQAVYVAAKLEIADKLASGPQTAADLAKQSGTHAPSLYRLLRALASVGVFRETTSQTFENTEVSTLLRQDIPGSQRPMALMMCEEHYFAWGELLYSVQTGEGSFRKRYGMPVFEYLGQNPEAAKLFDQAMTSIHGRETQPMVASYDFGQFNTVVDIGGGNGTLISAVLEQYPNVQGTLFDLPHVIERARQHLAGSSVLPRLKFAAGSFFEAVPTGADAYVMRHIIHDWYDDKCQTILNNIVKVMKPTSKVLVIESVIQPGNDEDWGKWLDLTMLTIPEGKERTAEEYSELFASVGLKLTSIVPTGASVSVIVAEKA